MDGQEHSNPPPRDLASILQTLSSFTTPRSEPGREFIDEHTVAGDGSLNNLFAEHVSHTTQDEDEYDPEIHVPGQNNLRQQLGQEAQNATSKDQERLPQLKSEPKTSVITDPRSIVTWPAALRYTTRLLHESPVTADRIRCIIRNQHMNERQWWSGREELVRKQRSRESGRAQIQEVLKSLGSLQKEDHSDEDQTADRKGIEEAAELNAYDLKVHRLMKKMYQDQERELAALKIPFIGLHKRAKAAFSEHEFQSLHIRLSSFLEEFVRE